MVTSVNYGRSIYSERLPEDVNVSLFNALSFRHYETVRTLLENGADPLVQDEEGRNAFFYLPFDIESNIAIRLLQQMEETTQMLPAEIWRIQDDRGQTPLFSIAPFLNKEFFNFLSTREVDFAAVDKNLQSALYFAYKPEAVDILAKVYPLNLVDRFGRTPLAHFINKGAVQFHAGSERYYDIALKLIDHGAAVDQVSLEEAYKGNRTIPRTLAHRLLEKGEFSEKGVTKLGLAIQLHVLDQVKDLIKKGENPNWKHKESRFSLLEMVAINNRDIRTFYYLLEAGAIPSERLALLHLYQALANFYRKEYASVEERHAAICGHLLSLKVIDPMTTNTEEYQILCKELDIQFYAQATSQRSRENVTLHTEEKRASDSKKSGRRKDARRSKNCILS